MHGIQWVLGTGTNTRQGDNTSRARNQKSQRLWQRRDFLTLWAAETISQFGTQITFLGVPLIAIMTLKATPLEVGILRAVEFVPVVLISLPAGVWVDRVRRRPLLIGSDSGRALALLVIPLAFTLGAAALWQLYLVVFVVGLFDGVFDVAYQAYLPTVISRDDLVAGNSMLEVSRAGARIGGPGLAGVLIALLTAPGALLGDVLSFVASALLFVAVRRPEPAPAPRADAGAPSPRLHSEIGIGLRYVLGHRVLRALAASGALFNVGVSVLEAVLLIYLVRSLGLTTGIIGLIFGLGNIGLLAGAASAGPLTRRFGLGWTIVGAASLNAVGFLLVPLAPTAAPLPVLTAAQFLRSFGLVIYNINGASLRQGVTPERLRGRMGATTRFISWSTIPLGSVLGGALAGVIGVGDTLWVGAVAGLCAIVPLALSPVRALIGMPPLDE